jgi:branched-chain amino acid transport system substrate-binding protein
MINKKLAIVIIIVIVIIILYYLFATKEHFKIDTKYSNQNSRPKHRPNNIRIGVMTDVSSLTADIGRDVAIATLEVVAFINDTNGVNGLPLSVYLYDTSYYAANDMVAYNQFKQLGVSAIIGWGTGETISLIKSAATDELPIISHSSGAPLTNPLTAPYNFVYMTDYSTNARGALTLWYENIWLVDDRYTNQRNNNIKPKIICVYDMEAPWTAEPIVAIKNQANILQIDVLPDINLKLEDTGGSITVFQINMPKFEALIDKIQMYNPDVVWHGNSRTQVDFTLKAASNKFLPADHLINNWGFDRTLGYENQNLTTGRIFGIIVSAFFGQDVPMMDQVVSYAKKIHPYVDIRRRELRTVQTWILFLMLRDILVNANGDFSGKNIKNQLESLNNWTIGANTGPNIPLGAVPITITPTDHRVSPIVRLYELAHGSFNYAGTIDMKQRFPTLWPQWLGY